jgi:glucosamine 6-phosphate synthetase-like amidotransferase/phosphosugar isomerase protein
MEVTVNLDNLRVIPMGKNQYIIKSDGARIFQSYDSIIAIKEGKMVVIDENKWDYSRTTGKYRNMFLDENKETTEKKIKTGEYYLADLNK